jgi:hypothetical protein
MKQSTAESKIFVCNISIYTWRARDLEALIVVEVVIGIILWELTEND